MQIRRTCDSFRAIRVHAGERLRVALLRSDDPHHHFLEAELAHRLHLVGVVIEPGRAQRARLWRHRRYSAWAWRAYQSWRQRFTGRAAYRWQYFASPVPEGPGGQRVEVGWVNSDSARAALARFAPDVMVICGTSYVHPEVLATAPLAVNVHGGYLPHYKGNHGIFFAYERSDFEHIGASLHVATAELDGGELIELLRPEVFPHDHDEHLYCRAVHAAMLRLCALLEAFESGDPLVFTPQPPIGQTYRHRDRTPGRELRLWLRRRLGLHPVPHLPPAVERPSAARRPP